MRKAAAIALASLLLSLSPGAQTLPPNRVLTHREQAPLKYRWVEQRFTHEHQVEKTQALYFSTWRERRQA